MNDEMEKLKARIAELERENAALKAKPPQKSDNKIDQDTWAVLQYFFDTAQNLTAGQIAAQFNLRKSIAQYHIDLLYAWGCLGQEQNLREFHKESDNTVGFVITALGRQHIMKRKTT